MNLFIRFELELEHDRIQTISV